MPQKQQRQPVSGGGASLNPKTLYLIAYNLVSAALWSVVLYRTATTYPAGGPRAVFRELDEYTRRTQTLALLEVVHSALGESPPSRAYRPVRRGNPRERN